MSTLISPQLVALGIDVRAVSATRKHTLGMEVLARDGCVYRYIRAHGNIGAGQFVMGADPVMERVVNVNTPVRGVGHVPISATQYGWIKVRGVHVNALASNGTLAGEPLVAGATDGQLERFSITGAGNASQANARRAFGLQAGRGVVALTNASVAHELIAQLS